MDFLMQRIAQHVRRGAFTPAIQRSGDFNGAFGLVQNKVPFAFLSGGAFSALDCMLRQRQLPAATP
jgi:hypothetical protein